MAQGVVAGPRQLRAGDEVDAKVHVEEDLAAVGEQDWEEVAVHLPLVVRASTIHLMLMLVTKKMTMALKLPPMALKLPPR